MGGGGGHATTDYNPERRYYNHFRIEMKPRCTRLWEKWNPRLVPRAAWREGFTWGVGGQCSEWLIVSLLYAGHPVFCIPRLF